jgi:ACS family glucarate transporter-like MFS transporter
VKDRQAGRQEPQSVAEPSESRVRWLLVGWIFFLGAVAFLDRTNIAIAGISIIKEYHFSNTQLGSLSSAFLIGYAAFQAPGGRTADWLGPRRVLGAAVLWWGIFTALTAFVPAGITRALLLFICIRFLLGVGEAVIYPASNQFVANWIPTTERGIANGIIFAGVGFGAGITPPLITAIIVRAGWRWSFWFSAAVGIAVGAAWFVTARDTPEEHPGVSPSELAIIKSGLTLREQTANGPPFDPTTSGNIAVRPIPWRSVFKSKEVLAITTSYFCYGYVAWIFFSWFFIYLATVRGLNLKASAGYSMLPFLAMASCSPLGGLASDALTRRRGKRWGRCGIAVLGIALAGVFLAIGSHVVSAAVASVILAGGAGALYLSQSSFWSVTADIAGRSSGSVSGVMNMGGQIGGAVTASLTPAIASRFGWTVSFLVAASLCARGSAVWLLVDPERALVEMASE